MALQTGKRPEIDVPRVPLHNLLGINGAPDWAAAKLAPRARTAQARSTRNIASAGSKALTDE